MPKVYAYISSTLGSDLIGTAIAEDGTVLATCASFARHQVMNDLGYSSNHKRDKYAAHYPDGFEVEWVDEPDKHEGVKAALELSGAAAS